MKLLTFPPESLETGDTANDITGSGTFIEVIVYLTDPSVKVSPEQTRNNAEIKDQLTYIIRRKHGDH